MANWRESARKSLASRGYVPPENRLYELKLNNGKEFGTVSYGAYNAVKNDRLNSYTPINDKEKKVLQQYKKYKDNMRKEEMQDSISKNNIRLRLNNAKISTLEKRRDTIHSNMVKFLSDNAELEQNFPASPKIAKNDKEINKYSNQIKQINADLSKLKTEINEKQDENAYNRVLMKYNIDPETFSEKDLVKWKEKNNYTPTGTGGLGISGFGLKKYNNSKEKDNDYKILSRIADDNALKTLAKKAPVSSSAATVAMAPVRGITGVAAGIENTVNTMRGKGIDINSNLNRGVQATGKIRNTVNEEYVSKWFDGAENKLTGNVGSFVYNTAMSMGDNVANLLFGQTVIAGLGLAGKTAEKAISAITSGLMSSEAAANSVIENKKKGLSDSKALITGLASGMAEYLTEKYSIEQIIAEPKTLAKGLLKSFVAESSEEIASNNLNRLTDWIINKDNSELSKSINAYIADGNSKKEAIKKTLIDCLWDDAQSGLAGGISGAAMGAAYEGANRLSVARTGKEFREFKDDIILTGTESPSDSEAYKNAEKLKNKKRISNYDIGKQYQLNVEQVNKENEAIDRLENILIAKGADDKSRQEIVSAALDINNALTGTDRNVRNVFDSISKITSGAVSQITKNAGTSNAYWNLFRENIKAVSSGNVTENASFITEYSKAYTEALKNNNPEKYGAVFVSMDGMDLSGKLPETVMQNALPLNVRDMGKYMLAAADVKNIVNDVGVQISNERSKIYSSEATASDKNTSAYSAEANDTPVSKGITLTRIGDFYEAYGDEALELANKLNLTPTTKIVNGESVRTVGFPVSSLDNYKNILGNKYSFTVSNETLSHNEAQKYNIIVSNLKRKAEKLGLLDRKFFTTLQNVNLYNLSANDKALISSEFHRVFAGNTDPLVTNWLNSISVDTKSVTSINKQNMPVSTENTVANEDVTNIDVDMSEGKKGGNSDIQLLEDYSAAVDSILSVSDETAKDLADKRTAVEILQRTPDVILDNVETAKDLKIIINYNKLYLAVRKDGVFSGHYHNLGAEIAKQLPQFLKAPDAIVQLKNGRLNLFSSIKTERGNNGIISVELNSTKDINGKYEDYNVVVTMFNSDDNYTKNILSGDGVTVKYKREDLPQVNPQLYKWLAIINGKSSDNNTLSQDKDIVNSSVRKNEGNMPETLKQETNSLKKAIKDTLAPKTAVQVKNMFARQFGGDGIEALGKYLTELYNKTGNIGKYAAVFTDNGEAVSSIINNGGIYNENKSVQRRTDDVYGNMGRTSGESSGKSRGGISEGTAGAERGGEARGGNSYRFADRKALTEYLRETGKLKKANIKTKSGAVSYNEIPIKHLADDSSVLKTIESNSKRGIKTVFISGYATIGNAEARGFALMDTAYIMYDNDKYTPQQINEHEIVHLKADTPAYLKLLNKVQNGLNSDEKRKVIIEFTKSYNKELGRYARDLINNGIAANEIETALEEYIWQEVIGDLNGEMGVMSEFAERFSLDIEEFRKAIALDSRNESVFTEITDSKANNAPAEYAEAIDAGGDLKNSEGNIRFNLKSPVEETRELVAYHNLSEEKLKTQLSQFDEGLPMPSIAITKDSIPHTNFGNISLVVDKNAIDPTVDKRNKVYGADAWTATFPQIEMKINSKAEKTLADKLGISISSLDVRCFDGVSAQMATEKISGLPETKRLFLKENKIEFTPVRHEELPKLSNEFMTAALPMIERGVSANDIINNAQLRKEFYHLIDEYYKKQGKEHDLGVKYLKRRVEKAEKGETAPNGRSYQDILNSLWEKDKKILLQYAEPTIIYSESEGIENAIKEHKEKYYNFVKTLVDSVNDGEYLVLNADPYNSDGSRKSFEETHLEFTPANVVKAMMSRKDVSSKNTAGFIAGARSIRASAAKEYKTLDEIRADKGRLQNLSNEDMQKLYDDMDNRLSKVIREIYEKTYPDENARKNRNQLIDFDTIGEIIAEIAEGMYTVTSIGLKFKSYGWRIDRLTAEDLKSLIDDLKEIPVQMFEAKPEKVIDWSEVKGAVVPDNTDRELVSMLEKKGITVAKYETGNTKSRIKALDNLPEVRFSLGSNDNGKIFNPKNFDKSTLNDQIDRWMNGELKPNDVLEFGDTPYVMTELGVKQLPVVMNQDVLAKLAGGKHDVALDTVRRLPALINDPIMILASDTVQGAYVILTDNEDKSGRPVIAALHINKRQNCLHVNRIASVYVRNNAVGFIKKQAESGNIKYIDDKKIQDSTTSRGLQLPKLVQLNPDNNIILYKSNIVNSNDMQSSEKYSDNITEAKFSMEKRVDSTGENRYNYNKSEQYGAMWTLKNNTLSKQEIAEFYSKISETKNQKYKNYVLSNDGDVIYEIGRNKLVYTDGDYDYPFISKVIEFISDYQSNIEYAKEVIYDGEKNGYQIENTIKIIEAVLGEKSVRTTAYGLDEAGERYNAENTYRRGSRSGSEKVNTDSRKDVRFNLNEFETQDLLMQIAQDIGYHDGLIEASKKNKSEFREVINENQRMRDSLSNAKRQMKRTTIPKVNSAKVIKLVREISKSLGSKADIKTAAKNASIIYDTYFKDIHDAGCVTELEEKALDNMIMAFQDIAADMIKNVEIWTESEDYKNLITYLRAQPISLSENIKNEINYPEFRKKNMGTLNLTNDGIPVDVAYMELSEMFPHLFSADIINPADQILEIADAAKNIRPQKYNPYEVYADDAINFTVEQLISDVDGLAEKPTKADKMAEKAEYEKYKALEKQRIAFERKYEKLLDEDFEYRNKAARKIEEQKYIRFWENKLSAADKNAYAEKIRENASKRYDKLKTDKDKVISNIRERQKVRVLKASIRNIANDLKKRLLNPTDSYAVPTELIKSIAEVSSKLDFTTDRTGKGGGENKSNLRLLELKNKYDQLKRDPDYDLQSEYDEELSERISELDELLKDKRIIDLSADELGELDSILRQIRHTLQTANKQLGKEKAILNKERGLKVIDEMSAQKGFDRNAVTKLLTLFSSEILNVSRIGRMVSGYNENSVTFELFEELNDGLRKFDKLYMEMRKPFDELITGKGNTRLYYNFTRKPVKTDMKFADGTNVSLPKHMICELIMLWDRKQGRTHLEKGGFTIPEFRRFYKGDIIGAFTTGQKTVPSVSENDIIKLKNLLDDYDKLWIETARKFFNGEAKDNINSTSIILKGTKIAEAENYITIHTDKNFVKAEMEGVKFDASIEGSGSLKATVKNASQPVYLMGLDHTVKEHIGFVAKYAGLAIPIRNFNKVYNVAVIREDGTFGSVKESIGQKWGINIRKKVIEQFISDLQVQRSSSDDTASKILSKLQSNWVAATLNANISVCVKQAASLPTASYVLGTKAVAKSLGSHMNTMELLAEIDTHTGAHYKRRLGLSLQELGDRAEANALIRRLTDKIDGFLVDKANLPSGALPSNWIQSVDVWTTAKLWLASKYYVEDELKIKRDNPNYWDEVTKAYEKTIEETQPNYDVMHRPEIQKTTNPLVRAIVMFQTQPLQNTGIFYSSLGNLIAKHNEYKNNKTTENKTKLNSARREFGRAVSALAASTLIFSLMTIATKFILHKVKNFREEKDGKVNIEKIWNYFWSNVMEQALSITVPAAGGILIDVKDKVVHDYDYEIPITSLINDTAGLVRKTRQVLNDISGKESYLTQEEKMKKVMKCVAELLKMSIEFGGLPAGNMTNIVVSVKKYIQDIQNGEIFSSDAEEYKPKYIYSYSDLAGAIISGNTKKEEKIKRYFDDYEREIKKGNLTQIIKPAYLSYIETNPYEAKRIEKNLIENYGYKRDNFREWVKKAEEENED